MPIFRDDSAICIGAALPAPVGSRPYEAEFTLGQSPPGRPFALTWTPDYDAVGYHVFRSEAVSRIRDRSINNLWRGAFRGDVLHFAVGHADVDTIIDDYQCRGANALFYWVLVLDRAGGLRVVRNLSVRPADEYARQARPVVLHPGGVATDHDEYEDEYEDDDEEEIEDEPTPTPAQWREVEVASAKLRQVAFSSYTAPAVLRIVGDGRPVKHYSVYLGTEQPGPVAADAMWDDEHHADNDMARWQVPPDHEFIGDQHNPEGSIGHCAVMLVGTDGSVAQARVALVQGRPPSVAVLR